MQKQTGLDAISLLQQHFARPVHVAAPDSSPVLGSLFGNVFQSARINTPDLRSRMDFSAN
jgi:hypothetical protein